jgi:hypothetical protein
MLEFHGEKPDPHAAHEQRPCLRLLDERNDDFTELT